MKLFLSSLYLISLPSVWAQAAAAEGGKPVGPMGGGLMGLTPWILIFVVFYFLLIRPQQKQAGEHKKMIDELKKGDRVLTQSGFYATISAIKGKDLEVKLNEDVKVLMSKSSVSQKIVNGSENKSEVKSA